MSSPSALASVDAVEQLHVVVGRDRRLRPARTTAAARSAAPCRAACANSVVDVDEVRHDLAARRCLALPISAAMPTSSSAAAVSVGVGSPRRRAVVQRARRGEAERAGLDAGAGDLAHLPRCPRAWPSRAARRARPSRAAAARRAAPGRRRRCRAAGARRASRYSANVCHSHDRPSCSAAPGMSSTPSISSMSRSWSAGRTGAKPTPQLPITTVVTPCHDDGASCVSHVAWPS